MSVRVTVPWHLLVSLLAFLIATSAPPPGGEYLFMSTGYNTRCVEIRDSSPVSENCPIDSQPRSTLRPYCNNCSDSYNKYEIKSGSSSVWIIPDVDRLNVFHAGKWSLWNISGCNPLLLQSFGSMLYVLCSVGGSEHQITVYVVNVTAERLTVIPIPTKSMIYPNVGAFFMKDDVHLCVAVDNNTLLFYNVRTGQKSPQSPPSCPLVRQLTPYEGADRKAHLLVECTDEFKTITLIYNTASAKFVNTSLLGSHSLGKNVLSPDGSVIARWKGTSCVFSQVQVNSPITIEFRLDTGAIHSASFNIVQNSLVFVVAVSGPSAGLYWFNVTLALATGGDMGGPQHVTGSAAVCVSTDCPGIALTDAGLVLATVVDGRQVAFYFLSNDSHFGPIDLNFDVARIVVIRSEEQATPSSGGYQPPHLPLGTTIGVSIGILAIVISAVTAVVVVFIAVVVCLWKHNKGRSPVISRHHVEPQEEVNVAHLFNDSSGAENPLDSTGERMEMVAGRLPMLPHGSSQGSSNASMPTDIGSARQDPPGRE